jgi:hypothetical protein
MAATNSYSKQQSSNESTNQQTGAGTGGAAIGAGSSNNTINVTNSDVQTVASALETVRDTVNTSTAASLASTQAALTSNTQVNQSALNAVVAVTGQAGSLLQSTFTQFTGALSDSNTAALTAQNNATVAGLELAGGQKVTSSQDITSSASGTNITTVIVVGLAILGLYIIFRNV